MIQQLKDVRVLGLLVFVGITLLVSWSTIAAIQTNYEFQKRIVTMEQENRVMELENNNQALRNKYYDTNAYLELAARRQFGKAAPGEKLLIVPEHVALAQTTDTGQETAESTEPPAQSSGFQKNFQAWMNFFMHRQHSSGT